MSKNIVLINIDAK